MASSIVDYCSSEELMSAVLEALQNKTIQQSKESNDEKDNEPAQPSADDLEISGNVDKETPYSEFIQSVVALQDVSSDLTKQKKGEIPTSIFIIAKYLVVLPLSPINTL